MSEIPDKTSKESEISEAELVRMFPTATKHLAQTTPSDFLKGMLSEWARNDPNIENILLGMFSGLPVVDFDVPDWVKRASRKFIEGAGLKHLCLDESADLASWMSAIGYGFGLSENLLQKTNSTLASNSKAEILPPLMQELKTFASNTNAEQSAAFFNARLKGETSRESAGQMTVRTKICMMLAVYWQDVKNMKSTAELHEFLIAQKTPDGENVFPSNIDSRETRRVCESIGLRFDNLWNKSKI